MLHDVNKLIGEIASDISLDRQEAASWYRQGKIDARVGILRDLRALVNRPAPATTDHRVLESVHLIYVELAKAGETSPALVGFRELIAAMSELQMSHGLLFAKLLESIKQEEDVQAALVRCSCKEVRCSMYMSEYY